LLLCAQLQLDPNFPDAYNTLACVLRERGGPASLNDAMVSYRTALRLKPDHPHAYNNLGNALRDQGLVSGLLVFDF